MTQEVVITGLVSIAARCPSSVSRPARPPGSSPAPAWSCYCSRSSSGWSSDAVHDLDKGVTVMAAILAVAGGGLVTTQVFAFVEDRERVQQAGAVLRGGAWIGALERLAVYVALVAGWAPGLAIVLAVKGLGRRPALNQEDTAVAERFIIGTFTSVLWAVACAGVAVLAP